MRGERLTREDGIRLFQCHDLAWLGALADHVRREKCGDIVYYNVNCHVNLTNICTSHCKFCAFGRDADEKGAYAMTKAQAIAVVEDAMRDPNLAGLHVVSGLHPTWSFEDYLGIVEALHERFPKLYMKGFTGVEITHFAEISGLPVEEVLRQLRDRGGLQAIAGGGAEILSDRVRGELCPNKATADEWLTVARTAHKLGSEIVRHGGIVLSGLTAGIDRSAAEGALDAGGVCVGVSGTAINLDFAGACTQSVARCGAVVSEFAPNMSVPRFGFRLRNRITSGLAVATVVVEAPEKSGALLFAEDAITQGREVFAVPGNADSHASVGSNALLKDGARPATCAWDVLGDFRRMFPGTLHERIAPEPEPAAPQAPPETGDGFAQVRRPVAEKRIDKPQPEAYIDLEAQLKSLTTEQLQIVAAIDAPGTQVDLIIEKTQLPASKVLAELTVLQIRGVVRQEPGKRFSLNIRAGTAQNHKELE